MLILFLREFKSFPQNIIYDKIFFKLNIQNLKICIFDKMNIIKKWMNILILICESTIFLNSKRINKNLEIYNFPYVKNYFYQDNEISWPEI